ncbi:MAG: hypothetical protein EPN30_06955 [Actinomycetota bacterium]|nr:MAG: hypothetical protein EPN30_06955 [Actinomycetota bacterium]
MINNARSDEGLSPLSIPSNFSTFPDYEKQLIIVNLERTSRGEPPIVGVTAPLNPLLTLLQLNITQIL